MIIEGLRLAEAVRSLLHAGTVGSLVCGGAARSDLVVSHNLASLRLSRLPALDLLSAVDC